MIFNYASVICLCWCDIPELDKKPSLSFNFTFSYINEDLSVKYFKYCDYVGRTGLEITDTSDTAGYALFLDLHLEIDRWKSVKYETLRQICQFSLCAPFIFM
jgi:hypothetical protein